MVLQDQLEEMEAMAVVYLQVLNQKQKQNLQDHKQNLQVLNQQMLKAQMTTQCHGNGVNGKELLLAHNSASGQASSNMMCRQHAGGHHNVY